LVVEDDGHGFDTAQQTEGFGMRSMRERAETLGGTFTLTSVPGRGTTVRIDIPPPA
jgi:signal transduction histidine kinase